MKKVISIGIQGFSDLREQDCFFVDKTNFIKEWWENRDVVTLITRPRRFGKTFAAVKAGNLKDAKTQIKQEIARLYEENNLALSKQKILVFLY